jgi:zinc protease
MNQSKSTRLALSLAVLLSTTALGAGLAPSMTQAQAPAGVKANPPFVFAQDHSDLKPDPAARFGRLANGMTYVIYKNATPPGTANVWMRIAAGSLMERESQRGLAHFIEHMAFNGSEHVPENEMTRILERDGLSFGADTNAFTSYDETVYMLNLQSVREPVIDDVLFLMRETADKLSMDPGAIDRERGVILGEERARASASQRAFDAIVAAQFPGQKFPTRAPIGLVDVIKTAPASRLVEFYHDFYRPEYATLIVVGDIDPDRIEAKIKAKFSDWVGKPQSDNALTDFGVYKPKGLGSLTYAEKGLRSSTFLSWAKPWKDEPETKQKDYDDTVTDLGLNILRERFHRAATMEGTAFQSANVAKSDVDRTAKTYDLSVVPKLHQDKAALTQALTIFRQYLTYGVTQDELDVALAAHETEMLNAVSTAKTRPNTNITRLILSTLSNDAVFTAPAGDYAFFEQIKPRLTLNEINSKIKAIDLGDGPMIIREGETVKDFDGPALEATYKAVMAEPVAPPVAYVRKTWPYTQFGEAGKVVARQEIADLGVTRVTFANGVTLTVKPTKFAENQVSVAVRYPGGDLTLAPKDVVTKEAAARIGLASGGLGKLTFDELHDALAGKTYAMSFVLGENAAEFGGATTTADLPTQMQVLMAFATDPGFRPSAMEKFKAGLPNFYISLNSSPTVVFADKGMAYLHSDDPRFVTPDQAAFMAVTNDDVRAFIKHTLDTGPIEITMVGDVPVDEAIEQVSRTFATLPSRPARMTPLPNAAEVRFPTAPQQKVFTHTGRPDQNLSVVAWPTHDFYANTQEAYGLDLLGSVMTLRLLDEVREKQGATYSAGAGEHSSLVFKGYGFFMATATVATDGDAKFYDSVAKIVEDLKTKPIGEDEMTRAIKPILEHEDNSRKTNSFWMSLLDGSVQTPAQLETLRHRKAQLMAVTSADLQRLANTYLVMSKAQHIQVKGEVKAADSAAAASK